MSKKMLIDAAHPEEVRVAVVSQNKIEDFDFESAARKPLRGNIFLARVTRVEPSLQAAFVDYGGNRHGFLAFSEIHPDYYQIPVSDRNLLQEAEQEVAELAAELELSQRGDDEDDEDAGPSAAGSDDEGEDEQDESFAEALSDVGDDEASEDSDNDADDEDNVRAQSDSETDDEAASPDDQRIERRETEEEEEEDKKTKASDDDEAAGERSEPQPDVGDEIDEDGEEPSLKADAQPEATSEDAAEDAASDETDAENDHDDAEAAADQAEASDDAAGDDVSADDDESDDGDEETVRDSKNDAAKSARAARNALFERYKNAKRKRANLLRNYKIQEVIKRRQILLIQVVKEERGNKGAALTTYLSLAGRYCVLMPNTARGGGISRKIANGSDRRRLRRVVDSLEVPRGMGLIIRTAGAKRTKTEIKRDYDYLLRLWENIRSLTLKSIAPCLIYEEASLIKRAIRDLYDKDISKVYVEGEEGYREAKDFMKMLMPSHAKNVQPYKERAPIFLKHGVETQLDGMYQPSVRLKSGGYIVIHQTEALVAIDVNSGRATRERNIEQTALKTNIEAAEEAARQFRLRDLAGLIVIDFIDMEEPRNNRKVERALKDAMKADRARVQIGRISPFGLLELSRQRRRSGIVDGTTQTCPTCSGAGVIRSHNMAALRILRAIEGEAIAGKVGTIAVRSSIDVSLHVLNHHRDWINRIEQANGVSVEIIADSDKHGDDYELETSGAPRERRKDQPVVRADQTEPLDMDDADVTDDDAGAEQSADSEEKPKKRRRRRRPRRDRDDGDQRETAGDGDDAASETQSADAPSSDEESEDKPKKRRRRGRRGGRRNRKETTSAEASESAEGDNADAAGDDAEKSADPATEQDEANAAGDAADNAGPAPTAAEETQPDAAPDDAMPSAGSNGAQQNGDDAGAHEKEDDVQPDASAGESNPEDGPTAPQKPARRGWWHRSAS